MLKENVKKQKLDKELLRKYEDLTEDIETSTFLVKKR